MGPVIKWSGSKRSQAGEITKYIQREYATYYQPFCGGCSVLAYILQHDELARRFHKFVCSDLNKDLIASFLLVKSNPELVIQGYRQRWQCLVALDIQGRKRYFEWVRERLNRQHDPLDFIFVMRTTTNGMPRYNRKGQFNNSFHVTRRGIQPEKFGKVVMAWSELLNRYGVGFECRAYNEISPGVDDLVYFDPPYCNTKGMYFGGFDGRAFFEFLGGVHCDWLLSYDGIAGEQSLVSDVPETLYKRHILIDSGNSSFRRVIGKDRHCFVRESLYLSY